MANPHFAKFADIWKHLQLLEGLRIEHCAKLGTALERVYEDARLPSGTKGSISFATFTGGL